MEKGDRFIFYGKTKTIKGVVSNQYEKTTYDLRNKVKVIVPYIVSDTGKTYRESMCLKIESDIGPNILRKLLGILYFR